MSFWYALIFFCSGAIAHKVLSRAIGIYYGLESFRAVEKYVIVYTVLNEKFIAKILEDSLTSLHEEVEPDLLAEGQEETSAALRTLFRKSVLVTLRNNYPAWMGSPPRYKSWGNLEAYANDVVKSQKTRKPKSG